METHELRHWLTLAHLPDLPAAALRRLLTGHSGPADILQCSDRDWLRAGATADACRARHQWARSGENHPLRRAVEDSLRVLEQQSAWLLVLGQPEYPALLAEIHDPPPLLFVAGRAEALAQAQFAVVGSRRCSTGGARAAGLFAAGLVDAGFSVCSGMALGIDGAAHRAALERDGLTVAVLGTGIDVCYPRRHADLRQAIVQSGALVSEFYPGTPPRRDQFPRRNRLISGLSVGVLVAEANLRSGSLITARLAMEQNREVYALPHSIFDPGGRGCHQLLREGACLAETAADVLADTTSLCAAHRDLSGTVSTPADSPFAGLGFDPVSIDELVAAGMGAADEVLVALQQLELDGVVEQHGGLYTRKVC